MTIPFYLAGPPGMVAGVPRDLDEIGVPDNYILYWLHTGCQWERLPIDTDPVSEKKKSATALFTTIFSSGVTIIA